MGPIRYRRAYYLCQRYGKGLFPFDDQAGLTARNLSPATERVATLAGTVADSFEKGADLLEEMIDRRADHRGRRWPSIRGGAGRHDVRPQGRVGVA